MARVFFSLFLILLLLLFLPSSVSAKNNIFGIHIINEADLEDAARLVNSNGGEWGHVTLVIREDEKDLTRWQNIFDRMRELKLIPIVRLATKPRGSVWEKPQLGQADEWAEFLNGLNWVIKDRYVIIFNEPNHAKEWGGKINPEEYASMLKEYALALKAKSADFSVLPAGLDAAAPDSSETMDMLRYVERMYLSDPLIFKYIDAWNSHSYPNPAFSSSPLLSGRASVRSFAWEVARFAEYGLKKNMPIFITETGWVHNENSKNKVLGFSSETVGKFFQEAFARAWSDKRIKAVTPFILNYGASPFDSFSWKKPGSSEYYPQYETVKAILKVKGEPEQIHDNIIVEHSLPQKAITESFYNFKVKFRNTGQSIWDKAEGFSPDLRVNGQKVEIDSFVVKRAKPQEVAEIEVSFHSPPLPGIYQISVRMLYKNKEFGELLSQSIEIVGPPTLKFYTPGLLEIGGGQDVKLIVYKDNVPVKEYLNLALDSGKGEVELRDISPEEKYRFVLLKPYHLPVQSFATVLVPETKVNFPMLFPLDRNNDGRLDWGDILSLF